MAAVAAWAARAVKMAGKRVVVVTVRQAAVTRVATTVAGAAGVVVMAALEMMVGGGVMMAVGVAVESTGYGRATQRVSCLQAAPTRPEARAARPRQAPR